MRRTAQSAGGSFRIRRLRVRRRRRNPTDETMQSTPRRDPEWEHWPGRPTGEEGVRSRLRALFVPSDAEDAITELITEHSRELETRAAELRGAVAELEQREVRARELHARVEQVLREGSAELDVRHSDLAVRAREHTATVARLAVAAGLGAPTPAAAVLPVTIGAPDRAVRAATICADHGVRVGCFRPPSVPEGRSCLRLTGRGDLTPVAEALRAVSKELVQ